MYGLVIYGLFLKSVSVAISEGSTVPPERRARDSAYIGCYDQVCLKKFENDIDVPQNATPDLCTASCKRYGFKVAALYNRTECACSCELNCLNKPENDNQCSLPCRGDVGRFCGGYFAASLYSTLSTNTSNGQCVNNNETSRWSPGGYDKSNDDHDNTLFYVAAGMGCAIVIGVIITLLSLRRSRSPASPLQPRSPRTHSNEAPRKTSDEHLDHIYAVMAEGDHQVSSVPLAPHGQTRPSDEHHEYMYADQLKPKPETSDSAVANDEDGYIIPDGPSAGPSSQVAYYSTTIHRHLGKDDAGHLKPKTETSVSAVANEEGGYIILDGLSRSPNSQVVYYSSKIPRHPGKSEGLCSQSPSPSVYYSSRIDKSEGK